MMPNLLPLRQFGACIGAVEGARPSWASDARSKSSLMQEETAQISFANLVPWMQNLMVRTSMIFVIFSNHSLKKNAGAWLRRFSVRLANLLGHAFALMWV